MGFCEGKGLGLCEGLGVGVGAAETTTVVRISVCDEGDGLTVVF